jgi:hypothetical protein
MVIQAGRTRLAICAHSFVLGVLPDGEKLLLIAQKEIPTEVRCEIEILRDGLSHDLDLHQQLPSAKMSALGQKLT